MAEYENDSEDGSAEDIEGTDDILEDSREGLRRAIDEEQEQRTLMLDDLKFATLDQWPSDLRQQRETGDLANGARPCLTIDQINQYITQVSNDMRRNRPSIKTRPVDDLADPDTAKVFQGLIRHIEDQSNAQIAYHTAGESAVTIGLGFFRIVTDYVSPDSFDQELLIKRVPDTFGVYLGPHQMPDGSDADEGWVLEKCPLERFKRDYPKASVVSEDFAGLGITPTWKTDETVLVCEYFYKKYTPQKIVFTSDGASMPRADYDAMPEPRPQITGERESKRVSVHWCKHTGAEIIDQRELKGQYIPIVEMVGKEKIVEGKRTLWGLVRPAKDSLRAFNYWISALTEKMALSPKAPFIGAVGQFATMGDRWDKANINNYSKLEYDAIDVNGNAVAAPRRQEPMQMEPAMTQMLVMMQNNVKSSLGMYKASIGDTDSQQSGRAILALQKESDTGTMHFGENQAISITHCGRILVDLIPHYYDTRRVLRILGEDGKVQSAAIDPAQKQAVRQIVDMNGKVKRIYNIGVGKYDVTATVGPGYTTSRQEAATVMTELANSAKDPISAAIMRYGAVKNSDFHGSEEIMTMLKAMLPPQLQQAEEGQPQIPPAAMQKIAQMQQEGQMMQEGLKKLTAENQQLKSGVQEGMAKVQVSAQQGAAELQLKMQIQNQELTLEQQKVQAQLALEREKVDAQLTLEKMKAEGALQLQSMKMQNDQQMSAAKSQFDMQCHMDKMKSQEDTAAMSAMPNLEAALGGMQKTLEAMLSVLMNPPPRQVNIGALRKDARGDIVGADISTKSSTVATLQ